MTCNYVYRDAHLGSSQGLEESPCEYPQGCKDAEQGRCPYYPQLVQLVNLTPHPVTFVTKNGETILELPGCPNPPRASETREAQGEVNGVPVNKVAMGQVQDLPEARPGVGYIVSRIVAEAARRNDLYIPDQTVRDEQGRIIGCRALAQV